MKEQSLGVLSMHHRQSERKHKMTNKKVFKRLFLVLVICFWSLFSVEGVSASTATDQTQSHSFVEIVKNEQGVLGGQTITNDENSSSSHKWYPKTNEIKTLGISFIGTLIVFLTLLWFYWRHREEEEEK